MTQPATGSYEALFGTLRYLFQTDIAGPLGLRVRTANDAAGADSATVWAQLGLEITKRGKAQRCHPGISARIGRRNRAELRVCLFVREENASEGIVNLRRPSELADCLLACWPTGRCLPFYDTRSDTISTAVHGLIHVRGCASKALDARTDGVMRHAVEFELDYLEESE